MVGLSMAQRKAVTKQMAKRYANRSIPLRAGANGRKRRPPTPEALRPPDHYGSTVTVVLIDGPCTRQTIEYMPGLTATNV
jgi:hypothetical protein